MQRSRRTCDVEKKSSSDILEVFLTEVSTRRTLLDVFSSPSACILRPSHIVRRTVGSGFLRVLVSRLNAPACLPS